VGENTPSRRCWHGGGYLVFLGMKNLYSQLQLLRYCSIERFILIYFSSRQQEHKLNSSGVIIALLVLLAQ